jgi:hypothetical protein
MRTLVAACLFLACGMMVSLSASGQQPAEKKGKYDPPALHPPDEATLKVIKEKTEQLRKAIAELKGKKIADDVLIEVEIYLKAAENIVRFAEWYSKDSVKWAQTTLDSGLERARQADGGKAIWRHAPGKWVLRAYRSEVDGSIQPYAVLLPPDFGADPKKWWRLDIVLHGRDTSLTESKFITNHQGNAPKELDYIQLEPYGRGNNAYRWAGEKDVFDSAIAFTNGGSGPILATGEVQLRRVVLRGFSMGGAGAWHIGLHYPFDFCLIGPGAGFTTTHGYVGDLPAKLPDYQEKCLHIYDAVDYAENAFNVPIVAYSGEIDPQKAAADNIEKLLKGFKEPVRFTHLIAPKLPHTMPKEWQEKAEIEYKKYAQDERDRDPKRIRFVTYTPQFSGRGGWPGTGWVYVDALERTYEKAVLDATQDGKTIEIKTTNIRRLELQRFPDPEVVKVDGQTFRGVKRTDIFNTIALTKFDGRWSLAEEGILSDWKGTPIKRAGQAGPIDMAFKDRFVVVGPTKEGWPSAAQKQFVLLWDKYFRGLPQTVEAADYDRSPWRHLVLFGDPETNPLIARALPKLPITWTKSKLNVNGIDYDPRTHFPVLIYPNPLREKSYIVLNSGHTFREADLKGTNALLYPRLGDWAVIKPKPTAKDPAGYEVVAAGLFDENWQFAKTSK